MGMRAQSSPFKQLVCLLAKSTHDAWLHMSTCDWLCVYGCRYISWLIACMAACVYIWLASTSCSRFCTDVHHSPLERFHILHQLSGIFCWGFPQEGITSPKTNPLWSPAKTYISGQCYYSLFPIWAPVAHGCTIH